MRACIISCTVLGLLWTTSAALAQEAPGAAAGATAIGSEAPSTGATQRRHRIYAGGGVGGGAYGADATSMIGLDAAYAYRTASGRDFGVTAMLATNHVFAGAFADVVTVPVTRRVSWRLGAEAGLHRISPRYSSFDLFPKHYEIVSAPNGVFLPYAGARASVDKTGPSGSTWGFELQILGDLIKQRHQVITEGWGVYDDAKQDVGGLTAMLGFYVGRAR